MRGSGECQDSVKIDRIKIEEIDCWPLLLHDVAMNCVNLSRR